MSPPPRLKLVTPETAATVPPGAPPSHPVHAAQAAVAEAAKDLPELRAAARTVEAVVFASPNPVSREEIARHLPAGIAVERVIDLLKSDYATRGVNLVETGERFAFRTAPDQAHVLERHTFEERKLSRAALETLAIIAYHQPVTRAEVEEIRGVATSKGTLDVLLETGWVRMRGRRRAPGRPVTYGTTPAFLDHFTLASIKDLPGLSELKGAGLLDGNLPPGFAVPEPSDVAALMPDEVPLEAMEAEDDAGEEDTPDLFDEAPSLPGALESDTDGEAR